MKQSNLETAGGEFLSSEKKTIITKVRTLLPLQRHYFDKVIYFLGTSVPYLQNVSLA